MAQAKSDGLQLLRAINATQAHGQEGSRVDPTRAAHEAGLDVGDVGSSMRPRWWGTSTRRPRRAPSNTTATPSTSFPRRALKLLEG